MVLGREMAEHNVVIVVDAESSFLEPVVGGGGGGSGARSFMLPARNVHFAREETVCVGEHEHRNIHAKFEFGKQRKPELTRLDEEFCGVNLTAEGCPGKFREGIDALRSHVVRVLGEEVVAIDRAEGAESCTAGEGSDGSLDVENGLFRFGKAGIIVYENDSSGLAGKGKAGEVLEDGTRLQRKAVVCGWIVKMVEVARAERLYCVSVLLGSAVSG